MVTKRKIYRKIDALKQIDGVDEVISKNNKSGYSVIVVTNQLAIVRGVGK